VNAATGSPGAHTGTPARAGGTPDRRFLEESYRRMLRIRRFEETVVRLKSGAEIAGACHVTIGQEAEVVGACMALRDDDMITGTHRSHGHPIAKGAPLAGLMAELFGKSTGICKGKGGSMHLADFSVGCIGETAIVGSGLPVAVGAGLSAQQRGTDQVVLAFFGDGASNTGAFHEALNLAAVWSLPVIFHCENNQYALTTAFRDAARVDSVADRAAAYGIPGASVDGQNLLAVHDVVTRAVTRARDGDGPTLVEARTYRFRDHSELGRIDLGYRTAEEVEAWRARDPLMTFPAWLVAEGAFTDDDVERIRGEVEAELAAAVEFARQSPFPGPEALGDDQWATPIDTAAP
jgi:pyruvate dehydrogenase E1 component alpha subunit